jgi:hypothetical protein
VASRCPFVPGPDAMQKEFGFQLYLGCLLPETGSDSLWGSSAAVVTDPALDCPKESNA